ncbi:MAG: GYD domain-containing protein [Candidatus Thorarchaeota archaeon]
MPIFVILGKFTAEGVKTMKEAPKRLKGGHKVAKEVGAELKAVYYTMGRYDYVSVVEAPSVESAMKGLFMLGAGGMSKTETLVGLSEDEALKLTAELS